MSLADLSIRGLYLRLFKQSAVYTTGTLLQQATSFLLLPLYLYLLSPADFGITALGEVVASILVAGISLGSHAAVTRFYWEWQREGVAPRAVGTLWVLVSLFSLLVTIALQIGGAYIFPLFVNRIPFDPYLRVVLWTACLGAINQVPLALLRAREEATVFVRWSYVTSASALLFSVYFVAVVRQGALGVLHGVLASTLLATAIGVWLMTSRVRVGFRGTRLRQALRFALPLVPGGLLEAVIGGLDRFILDKFVSLREIGLYSVAQKIANLGVRALMYTSFKTAWCPFTIRLNTERPDGPQRTARLGTLVLAGAALMALITVLFAGEALVALGRPEYLPAVPMIAVLVSANFVLVIDLLAWVGLMMGKRSATISLVTVVQLLSAAAAYLLLIPRVQALGAAIGTLVSIGVAVGLKLAVARRAYPIPYEWGRVGAIAGVVVVTTALGLSVGAIIGPSFWAGLGIKSLLLLGSVYVLMWIALRGLRLRDQLSALLADRARAGTSRLTPGEAA